MSRWSPSFRLGAHPDDFATALQQIGGAAEHVGDAAFDRRRQRIADDEVQSRDRARQAEAERIAAEDKARIQARQDAQKAQEVQNAQKGIFNATDPGLYTGERQYYQAPNLLGLDGALQVEGRKRREDVTGLGHDKFYDPTRDQDLVAKNRELDARRQERAESFADQVKLQGMRGDQEREQILLRGAEARRTATTPRPPRGGGGPAGKPPISLQDYKAKRIRELMKPDRYTGMMPSLEDATKQAEQEHRAAYGAPLTAQEEIVPPSSETGGGDPRLSPDEWRRSEDYMRLRGMRRRNPNAALPLNLP